MSPAARTADVGNVWRRQLWVMSIQIPSLNLHIVYVSNTQTHKNIPSPQKKPTFVVNYTYMWTTALLYGQNCVKKLLFKRAGFTWAKQFNCGFDKSATTESEGTSFLQVSKWLCVSRVVVSDQGCAAAKSINLNHFYRHCSQFPNEKNSFVFAANSENAYRRSSADSR